MGGDGSGRRNSSKETTAAFRDAEGRFVTWRDIDFRHMTVKVKTKPQWGFHPKNWEEREIPVPEKLIELLKKFRPATAKPDDPVFPSATGRPDGAMLEKLKPSRTVRNSIAVIA